LKGYSDKNRKQILRDKSYFTEFARKQASKQGGKCVKKNRATSIIQVCRGPQKQHTYNNISMLVQLKVSISCFQFSVF